MGLDHPWGRPRLHVVKELVSLVLVHAVDHHHRYHHRHHHHIGIVIITILALSEQLIIGTSMNGDRWRRGFLLESRSTPFMMSQVIS